jgi:hypothetical protein
MTLEQKVEFLENKLDNTLLLLKEIVNYTTVNNEDNDYLIERIEELYSEDLH